MTKPDVGLLVDRPTPQALSDTLGVLQRWCHPLAWDNSTAPPAAWITTSPRVATPTDAPRAVWIESHEEAADPDATGAAVLLCGDARLAQGEVHIIAVGGTLNASDVVPVTPFVRARYRRARGLPAELIVGVDDNEVRVLPDGPVIDGDLRATALALASAAVVRGESLAEALAWGTPCVTDATSAAAIGAAPGVDVIVESDRGAWTHARDLARDELRIAAMSRAGRRFVETVLDRVGPARRVATALGLQPFEPDARLEWALDDLNTPAAAPIRARAGAALPA